MKPTTDIVEELRLYNRWRRGDEAITAPDPTTLGKLLDDAADRIEHLFASGIHTCHADCQRPMCVLRRERDKAQADLARVTAERDGYVSDIERFVWNLAGCDTIASGWGKPGDYAKSMALPALDSVSRMAADHAALRARVAELEEREVTWRAAQKACETCDAPTYAEFHALKQRNAELEETNTKLRGIVRAAHLHCLDNCTLDDAEAGKRLSVAEQRQLGKDLATYGCRDACAESATPEPAMLIGGSYDCPRCGTRHPAGPCGNFERDSTTPAKHPDTVPTRIVRVLGEALREANGSFHGSPKSQHRIDCALKEYDAAMKGGTLE